MRTLVWSVIVLAGLAAGAEAQTLERRGTVAGNAGGGRTWDDEGSLGTGAVVGGRVDWKFLESVSLEASVDVLSHDRSGGAFEAEGRTAFIGASLLKRFGAAAARPYVLVGYHLAQHSGSTTFLGERRDRDSTGHGFHFGGGVMVRIGERFELGPEARFYMIKPDTDSDPALAYWIGVRFGVQF